MPNATRSGTVEGSATIIYHQPTTRHTSLFIDQPRCAIDQVCYNQAATAHQKINDDLNP